MKKDVIFRILQKPKMAMIFFIEKCRLYRFDDETYLKVFFDFKLNRKLNLNNPTTFNEKLQWLKLYDRNPKYIEMVDKYAVKEYISNKIGAEYIIPNLGVWERFDEIDFSKLPNQFVLKCTHDSGGLVICRDKHSFNIKAARKKINKSLKNNFYYYGREWPYRDVKPRIIAEKFMVNDGENDLTDYKFFCFNGEPEFIYVSKGLENHETARIDFLDMDYNRTEFYRQDYLRFEKIPEKPKLFEEMKEIARKLSEGTKFLRVDLYEINNKIYFSELTFYPCSGFMLIEPEEYDRKIGELIQIDDKINS